MPFDRRKTLVQLRPTRGGFSPTQLSGTLALWLDASDPNVLFDATVGGNLVSSDNGAVARFEDKSASAFHLTQSTAGDRPALKLAAQNGKNYLLFDWTVGDNLSGSKFLSSAANWSTIMPAGTNGAADSSVLFMVASRITGAGAQSMAQRTVLSDNGGNYRLANENANPANGLIWGVNISGAVNTPFSATANAWQIICLRRRAGTDLRMSANGGTETVAVNSGAQTLSGILHLPTTAGGFKCHLRFGEMILQTGPTLTNADCNQMLRALAAKWGITVTDLA